MELQFWPGRTLVGHQNLTGFRLRFNHEDPLNFLPPRLEFEFTRSFHHAAIHQILPPTQLFRSPFHRTCHVPTKPYELLRASNRFLRDQHPQIDLPKTLLLDNLLEDQDLSEHFTPLYSHLLTGLSINRQHAIILSVGGHLGDELHCTLLPSHQSTIRRFYRNPKPAITLRTPILQISNGPSLNLAGQAVFLARTHDSTSSFIYSPPDSTDFSAAEFLQGQSSYCPTFGFETTFQLKTCDTNHETHVDSCVGHTINDIYHQFIVLNSKGQLWKVSGIGANNSSLKQVGQIHCDERGVINWARCGVYPMDDCLVVGLRKSVEIVDPRLSANGTKLYAVSNGDQITDMQRYNNNRSPHLRLINTTSSIVWIDDRKPQVPILDIKHFRTPDLTLSITFSAEPTWSPHPSYSLSTAGERFDHVLLWSRTNDVASLHQFKSYPTAPPGVVGHGVNVPLASRQPSNYRTGLFFFCHQAFNNDPQKISLVEMKRDGSVWHEQLNLDDPNLQSLPIHPLFIEQTPRETCINLEKTGDVWDNINSNREVDELSQLPHLEIKLDALCHDFTRSCLEKLPSTGNCEQENRSPFSKFLDPLYFSKSQSSLDPSNSPEEAETPHGLQSSIRITRNPVIDLVPVLKLILPRSAQLFRDDETNIISDVNTVTSQKLESILTEAKRLSTKIELDQSSPNPPKDDNQRSGSIAVKCLLDEWTIGEPTSEYEWKDIFRRATDDQGFNSDCQGSSIYSCSVGRSQSRLSSMEPSQDLLRSSPELNGEAIGRSEFGPHEHNHHTSSFRSDEMLTPKGNQQKGQSSNPFNLFCSSPPPNLAFPSPHSSSFNKHAHSFNSNHDHVSLSTHSQPILSHHHTTSQHSFNSTPSLATIGPSFNHQLDVNHNQTFSQLIPGPHSARSITKKKRRMGGF